MTPKALLAWGFIAVTLAIFADIPQTADVSVAFAYLILLAVLLQNGVKVFEGLTAGPTLPLGVGAEGTGHATTYSNPGLGVGAGATGQPGT